MLCVLAAACIAAAGLAHFVGLEALTTQAISGGRFVLGIGLSHQVVIEGMFGMSLPKLLAAEAKGGKSPIARAKSVIFLFQWGGPSHLETFDMKPDAPDSIRGPYRPIVVGPENKDPYPEHGEAIEVLGQHFNIALNRDRCFPYRRD